MSWVGIAVLLVLTSHPDFNFQCFEANKILLSMNLCIEFHANFITFTSLVKI